MPILVRSCWFTQNILQARFIATICTIIFCLGIITFGEFITGYWFLLLTLFFNALIAICLCFYGFINILTISFNDI